MIVADKVTVFSANSAQNEQKTCRMFEAEEIFCNFAGDNQIITTKKMDDYPANHYNS